MITPEMKTKLLLITITSYMLLFVSGCRGTIPEILREPVQEATEEAVKAPQIDLYVRIRGLSSVGLNLSVEASISNYNRVTLDIGDLQVVTKGETGRTYFRSSMPGSSIAPNSSSAFTHSVTIPIEVMNERSLTFIVNTRAGVAGISLPIKATAWVQVPSLTSLISIPKIEIAIVKTKWKATFPLPSVEITTETTINNSNDFGLVIGDVHMSVYESNGELIKAMIPVRECTIQATTTRSFSSLVLLGAEFLGVIGSTITIEVGTDVGISGINERIPIEAEITIPMMLPS